MSDGFGKLYEQTFTGSMVGIGPTVFAVWAYVVAHLRPPGTVELNPALLSAAIGTSVEEIEKAILVLTSPDPKSRHKQNEGRRLLQIEEYLYQSPTFEFFRNGKDTERKAQAAARQKAFRERKKSALPQRPPPGKKDPQGPTGRHLKRDGIDGLRSTLNHHVDRDGID